MAYRVTYEMERTTMNLPNKLTTGRIIMVFVMIGVLLYPYQVMPNFVVNGRPIPLVYLFSLAIFILASITDFLDGYLARKLNLITNLGKFLDPLADKLLTNSLLILLMMTPAWLVEPSMLRVPAWAVIIMITRDFTVDGIRMIAVTEGKVLAANVFGKVKTFLQIFAIIFYLLNDALFASLSLPSGWSITEVTLYVAAIASLLSLINYVQQGWKFIRHG
jgi:CDP-diacylglycerol--glycerol-3-phosphate 3-phosphatidyltransferase